MVLKIAFEVAVLHVFSHHAQRTSSSGVWRTNSYQLDDVFVSKSTEGLHLTVEVISGRLTYEHIQHKRIQLVTQMSINRKINRPKQK
jgi:hypothetical protein